MMVMLGESRYACVQYLITFARQREVINTYPAVYDTQMCVIVIVAVKYARCARNPNGYDTTTFVHNSIDHFGRLFTVIAFNRRQRRTVMLMRFWVR